jgi:putative transcriptional regulator
MPPGVTTRVREFRGARGWSQGELAELVGVSRQTINAIETGRYEPSLALALQLAGLFAVPVEHLFLLVTPGPAPRG